jgi:hypothetical protein
VQCGRHSLLLRRQSPRGAAVAFSRNALLNGTTCYLLRAEYMLLRHESSMCGQLLLAIAPVVENDFPGRFFEREAGK